MQAERSCARLLYTLLLVSALFFNSIFTVAAQSPTANPTPSAATQKDLTYQTLLAKARAEGTVRVIVGLALPRPFAPEGDLLSPQAIAQQRAAIDSRQQSLLGDLAGFNAVAYAKFETVPFVAINVDESALTVLNNSGDVSSIEEDKPIPAALASSIPVIGAPGVWATGNEGSGQIVAILDTGVDAAHPFLGGRVVLEACLSNAGGQGAGQSLCPGGENNEAGAGTANPNIPACLDNGEQLCDHGTHVAGIAAGKGSAFSGVAPSASIWGFQVFTRFGADICGGSPCVGTYPSDYQLVLEVIAKLKEENPSLPVAAVNLSLGGGEYNDQTQCDNDRPSLKAVIDNLRSLGIATIAAAGNEYLTNALGAPGCISSAVAVGATTDDDQIGEFSNMHEMVDLLAPGVDIESSIAGGGFGNISGTSMATPMVTGAWALLKSINPTATVDEILDLLVTNGVAVTDGRPGGTVTKPRIKLDDAGANPQLVSITPSSGATGTDLTVRITGDATSFAAGETEVDFGAGITVNSVTVISVTELEAAITIAADAQPGVRSVRVSTGTEVVSKADGFTVTGITLEPSITAIEPDHADRGTSLNVTISGENTNFVAGRTQVDFGTGITVNSVTVNSATELIAAITIDAAAEPGERTVEVNTGDEMLTVDDGFRVDIPTPPTGNSTLYFNPSPATMNVGETRTLEVIVDPGTTEINGVQINGQLDPAHLELLTVTSNPSVLDNVLEPVTFDATTGSFRFSAGILGQTVTEPFTLLTLEVRAIAATGASGTALKFLNSFPPTDISGPSGSIMEAALDGVVIINTVGDSATMIGHVDLQGRPDAPDPSWSIPLSVTLMTATGSELIHAVTTDEAGNFTIEGITPSTYSVRVKGDHTLGNQVDNVELVAGTNEVYLGELLEGDVETSRSGNQTVLADFGQLSGAFDTCVGDSGYLANADLNETDGCVTIEDYGLLSPNYNKQGWNVYDASLPMPLPLPFAQPNAILAFANAEQSATVNRTLDLPLFVDPRGGDAVTGLTVHLSYDPTLLEITDVELSGALPKVLRKPTLDPETGSLRFSVGANLGQSITARVQVATVRVVLLAETDGAALTLTTGTPRDTNIAGTNGSVMAAGDLQGITLRGNPTGTNAYNVYLPAIRQ